MVKGCVMRRGTGLRGQSSCECREGKRLTWLPTAPRQHSDAAVAPRHWRPGCLQRLAACRGFCFRFKPV